MKVSPVDGATAWECPCGTEPPKPGRITIPVRTLISLREPKCGFCGRAYSDEHRVTDATVSAADRVEAVHRHLGWPAT